MSTETSTAGGKFAALITSIALLVSAVVATILITVDIHNMKQVSAARLAATVVPASGKLLGQSRLEASIWSPPGNEEQLVVLFGVAESGRSGDLQFWRDVASRSRALAPDIQFVGLCLAGGACDSLPDSDPHLTLLDLMDPAQTHALMTAVNQRRAFVYRGAQVQGSFPVLDDRQELATRIAGLSGKDFKAGGA